MSRAPVFSGNAYPAISAFLRVDAYWLKNKPVGKGLITSYDSSFGALANTDTALKAGLGNFIRHVSLPHGLGKALLDKADLIGNHIII